MKTTITTKMTKTLIADHDNATMTMTTPGVSNDEDKNDDDADYERGNLPLRCAPARAGRKVTLSSMQEDIHMRKRTHVQSEYAPVQVFRGLGGAPGAARGLTSGVPPSVRGPKRGGRAARSRAQVAPEWTRNGARAAPKRRQCDAAPSGGASAMALERCHARTDACTSLPNTPVSHACATTYVCATRHRLPSDASPISTAGSITPDPTMKTARALIILRSAHPHAPAEQRAHPK